MKPEYKTGLDFTNYLKTEKSGSTIDLYALTINDPKLMLERTSSFMDEKKTKAIRVGPSKILIKVPVEHAQEVLTFTSKQEEVYRIERKLKMKLLNHAANMIIQGDGVSFPEPTKRRKRVWDHGITGKGEIVGIGDTGIDHDMCFFYDPKSDVPFDTVSDTHRKIRGYKVISFVDSDKTRHTGDRYDYVDGHGTHTAGSIAGHILNTSSTFEQLHNYDGVAPDAKLYFTDIGKGEELSIPDDLYNEYFQDPYKGGAKIHSNSWGCDIRDEFICGECFFASTGEPVPKGYCEAKYERRSCCNLCNSYASQASEVDQFTFDHDDFLIIFAAGNAGHTSSLRTIGAPATSKNAIAVGASHTFNDNFRSAVDHTDFSAELYRNGFSSTKECCQSKSISALASCCPSYIKLLYANDYFSHEHAAYFSSRGPTLFDGRTKPDLVAPGYQVQSMHSDGSPTSKQCGVGAPRGANQASILSMKGTSMSAPIVAGGAALVRQYLRERIKLENPSGALIKATLIHGSRPMPGNVDLDGRNRLIPIPKVYPNPYVGYGLLSLSSVLSFDESDFKSEFFDRVDASVEGRHCYVVQKDSVAPSNVSVVDGVLRATLSWYDRPSIGDLYSASLVSDLDLDIFVWNHGSSTSERYPGNNSPNDDVNTVERSEIKVDQLINNQTVLVLVRPKKLGGSQTYSLVISTPKYNVQLVKVDSSVCDGVPVPTMPINTDLVFKILVICAVVSTLVIIVLSLSVGCYLYKKGYGNQVQSSEGRRLGDSGWFASKMNKVKEWWRSKRQEGVEDKHQELQEDTNSRYYI
ncbi:hypothetical protein AKO1_011458 [Acrasis kona]|uniref:Peptidase S8/S53 domain-containing protein n=1 Tax=Acrasis kona TaxID=1008807 RepID=A0AAW2Z3V5_9EUKA